MAARGGKKVNKAWLHEHLTDPYVKLAQSEGFRSRAAYKLKEIDEQLHLFTPGQLVVDLGAAPGAWSQYVRRRLGRMPPVQARARSSREGTVIALDRLAFDPIEGVAVVEGDFREPAVLQALQTRLEGRKVDVVVSDLAPNLSGIAAADAAAMADLVDLALEFACRHLKPEGALVCKVFHGSGYSQLVERFKMSFRSVKVVKPKASRARSSETFLVGKALKAGAGADDIRA